MIPAYHAQEAIAMAAQLEALNRRVSAVADTPLAKLVSVSSIAYTPAAGAIMTSDDVANEYIPDATGIEADTRMSSLENESLSQHDMLMDSAITDLASVVGQHLTFAKNTVRPLIQDWVNQVSAALSAYPDQSSYTPTIVKIDLPEVALISQIESDAQKFKDVPYNVLNAPLALPAITEAAAVELMKTGSAAVDAAIDLWVQEAGSGFFLNAYNAVYCASAEGISQTPEQILIERVYGNDNLVAAFLMGRRLLEMPPEGTEMSLAQYKVSVGGMLEQLGLRLVNAYADRQRNVSQQNLILAVGKDTAWVFAPVYDQWVKDGNNVAILFGNLLLDRPNRSVPAIMEDASQCMEVWERQNRFLTLTLQNRMADVAKETMRFHLYKLVGENLVQCFGEVVGDNVSMESPAVQTALQNAQTYIQQLTNEQIQDVWHVGTVVVAMYVFGYSAAYDILNGIEQAVSANADIDPNEAALMSTSAYVSDYVLDQILVSAL